MPAKPMKAEHSFLCSNIHHFKQTAVVVEEALARERFGPQDKMSMKAVSHFNLGTALELMFKLMLILNKCPFKKTHLLADLYDLFPKHEQDRLDVLHGKSHGTGRYTLVAMAITTTKPKSPPSNRDISTLRGTLEYFDKDMGLCRMRYSWEEIAREEWRHHLEDISPYVRFIDENMKHLTD